MKTALFVCYGGGHAEALIPVIKYLTKNTDIKVEAIGINLAANLLRENGIPCKTLSNYLDVKSIEIGFPIAKQRHNFSSHVSFADSIAYYGFSMCDLINEVGKDSAYQILKIFDRRTMFPVRTMIRILQLEAPDVVITTTMNRFEAATLYAAGMLGIPSLKVEDLIGRIYRTFPDKIQVDSVAEKNHLVSNGISPEKILVKSQLKNPIVMSYYEKVYQLQIETRPTAFAVVSEFAKNEILKRGIDPNSIHITGQPAFDKHPWYLINTKKEKVSQELNINPNIPIITFMSQPNAEREDVFRILINSVKRFEKKELNVIVKLHPNEDGRIQKIIMQELGYDRLVLIKNIDARELIAVSDVVITVSSTTGIEAAVMGKPLIYINATNKEDYIPFSDMGIGIKCTNPTELYSILSNYLYHHKLPELKGLNEYKTDGKASSRVGHLIKVLANKEYKPSKKVLICIQARMGSKRLPGKVMKCICGKPQIQHVYDNVSRSKFSSDVVVLTSVEDSNKSLKEYLTQRNIRWLEGDENDVLSRFIYAGEQYDAPIIVRVTADNPLCNPECIDMMIESHIQRNADYTMMKGLPVGIAGEVVNYDVLKKISHFKSLTGKDKEHVTLYIYEHPELFSINYISSPLKYNYPEINLTVDTADDFNKMNDIYEHCYHNGKIQLKDVIEYLNRNELD